MTEAPLVQFAGFISKLDTPAFLEQWKDYAATFEKQSAGITLWRQQQTRGRYAYISLLHWQGEDFQFSFMGKRKSDYFPDRTVRVVQGGGYMEAGGNGTAPAKAGSLMVMVLIQGVFFEAAELIPESFNGWYREYRAFYESCLYGQFFCFGASEDSLPALLEAFKKHDGVEVCVYALCYASQPETGKTGKTKKTSRTVQG